MNLSDKRLIHKAGIDFLTRKTDTLQTELNQLQESVQSESKSSAGDKHETSREMLAQEQNLVGKQLEEAQNQLKSLEQLSIDQKSTVIRKGSLIITPSATYYLAAGIGKLIVNRVTVFCISLESPVGKLLLGRSVGDVLQLNGNRIEISAIL